MTSVFKKSVRIPLCDVDVTGCLYHGHFLKYYDQARTDYLDSLGLSHARMIKEGAFFVVKSVTQEFLKPVLLDRVVDITVTLNSMKGASLGFHQAMLHHNTPQATAQGILVYVSHDFKPKMIPKELISKLFM